jgi:mannose-6-phosphate isomerase-like protein (cupin superfamily)
MICYANLPIQYDTVSLQKEVQLALTEKWKAHFNQLYYEGEWNVLTLKAPGGNVENIFAEQMSFGEFEETAFMQLFPTVKHLLKQFECETNSVRFLNLKAGASIKKHRDNDLAFEKGEARIHLPVFTNEAVEFYIDDELIKMQEGEAWYINANLPHAVNNFGSTDRIHLVIDCKVNDWLKQWFERSKQKTKKPVKDIVTMQKIINELRLQNTPSSLSLADEMAQEILAITNTTIHE